MIDMYEGIVEKLKGFKEYAHYSNLLKDYALRLREKGIEFAGQLMVIGTKT